MTIEAAQNQDKVINKIKGLFALANDERGNENQSAAALAKAYELLTRHNLDKNDVLGFVKPDESYNKGIGIEYESRTPTEFHYIFGILEEFFNVSTVKGFRKAEYTGTVTKNGWSRRKGTDGVVWFVGKQENIDIAKVIYNQLYFQYKYLWEKYRQRTDAETKDKRNYYQGLMVGLFKRLREEKSKIENELSLVIVKDPKIQEAVDGFFTNVKQQAMAKYESNSHIRDAGFIDSKNIQLNQAISAGSGQKLLN